MSHEDEAICGVPSCCGRLAKVRFCSSVIGLRLSSLGMAAAESCRLCWTTPLLHLEQSQSELLAAVAWLPVGLFGVAKQQSVSTGFRL